MLMSVADSLCGYGAVMNLPAGTTGLLTAELNINFLGTLSDGWIYGESTRCTSAGPPRSGTARSPTCGRADGWRSFAALSSLWPTRSKVGPGPWYS